jgi:hypothetical protein
MEANGMRHTITSPPMSTQLSTLQHACEYGRKWVGYSYASTLFQDPERVDAASPQRRLMQYHPHLNAPLTTIGVPPSTQDR